MYSEEKKSIKSVLVIVNLNKNKNFDYEVDELKSLAESVGSEVVAVISQNREKPDQNFLIGPGKIQEIKEITNTNNANLIIFQNELSGSKINNLEKELETKVIDRSMLILDIFARRAKTSEGMLQAELAQLRYSLPRLNSLQGTQGRYGAGVGMRGPGETKLELDRRVIEKKISIKQKELDKLKRNRDLIRSKRVNSNKKMIAIVGYTNSGKSTLLNKITKADILAKDMLFSTLETTTRNVWLAPQKEILLTDTVGFVSKLPHEFIEAFSSTLEESVYSDILVHVIDSSSKVYESNIKTVYDVLDRLGALENKTIITVFNKIDLLENTDEFIRKNNHRENTVFISAKNKIGLDDLRDMLIELI